MNKKILRDLINEFLQDCRDTESSELKRINCVPSFENFIEWVNDRKWNMV